MAFGTGATKKERDIASGNKGFDEEGDQWKDLE